jgi:hypothetical protein
MTIRNELENLIDEETREIENKYLTLGTSGLFYAGKISGLKTALELLDKVNSDDDYKRGYQDGYSKGHQEGYRSGLNSSEYDGSLMFRHWLDD